MDKIITVCNQICDKRTCPHHIAKLPFSYNPRFIEYVNFKSKEGCLIIGKPNNVK